MAASGVTLCYMVLHASTWCFMHLNTAFSSLNWAPPDEGGGERVDGVQVLPVRDWNRGACETAATNVTASAITNANPSAGATSKNHR